jgi:hypothetical protein
MSIKTALLTVVLILFGTVAFFYWNNKQTPELVPALSDPKDDLSAHFSGDGVVVRDNPGMKSDIWYFVYEKPGSPALTAELDLNSVAAPYIDLTQGERVHIEGSKSGSVIVVTTIIPASPNETGIPVKLYYYDPMRDQGAGGAQCSKSGLVAVERVIPQTTTPLKDTVQLLLRGELSDEERAAGITTEFSLPGVSLTDATLTNGIATLTFADPQNKLSGGSCRVAILWAEVEATAKQFPSVVSVHFKPETLFQP